MDNSREQAILGGLGLCLGATLGLFLPAPDAAVPLFGLAFTVFGMAIATTTNWRLQNRVPARLQTIQDARQYARVYRL